METDKRIIIVGAGISGATLAERYASIGKQVLVLEKRDHIGGNCYDYTNSDGIRVPRYGGHIFHTNDEGVWEYVNRFSKWRHYEHHVRSLVDGKYVPVPVNIETVNTVFGLNITTEEEMKRWLDENTEKIANPKNSEESALRRVGRVLYEKMFKYYTHKQWNMWPAELDASVMDRIPVRTNFNDRYFSDTHEAIPAEGYTKIFETMLAHPNIEVRLNADYFAEKDHLPPAEKLFFTGPVDAFFKDKNFEKLQYRSLRFEYETFDEEHHIPYATVNYPDERPSTRTIEPKYMTGQKHPKTTVIYEYPTGEGEPYYPVPNPRNAEIYAQYQREAEKLEPRGIYFVGRLATYKYFNMDQAFRSALDLFEKLNPSRP
jgi:UDP-galactopyranose mutase